jgi:hypothetical protein
MEWILIGGCCALYFGGSLMSKPPSRELIDKLFTKETAATAAAAKIATSAG